MNDFVGTLNSGKVNSYRAYFDIGNGKVGITAEYSREVLDMVIEEKKSAGYTLLRIEKVRK